MNKEKGKRILATAIGAISLLIVAFIIFIITATVLKWNVLGWFTTTQAYLVYMLAGLLFPYFVWALVMYIAVWRHK